MQTKQQIQSLLAQAGLSPRHRFGQNFMIDQNLLRLVAEAGRPSADDVIIEIGPGTGTLTEELLASGAQVIAVEIDRDLAALLGDRFRDQPCFRLIEGDALDTKHALNTGLLAAIQQSQHPTKLIANLPYNIASPLIIEMLLAGVQTLAFTVQKEVAQRLRAKPGTDDYGALSVMAQLLSKVEILRTLPPTAFWPAPKIDSALVRIMRDDRLGARAREFGAFLKKLFSSRRKTLRKTLTQLELDGEAILNQLHLDPNIRAENLSPEQLLLLFDTLNG
ncbi:MAG TPA: 16S rRNA (adenine(1518)-N(6)/adenine(1519)-N(6))-dimethyltransferase RsmA [Tepidisphaeraceae bacterium]|nr:16S rRNA (adenine(1518)-N(6)/adenine(1519)-N(6))-dimethyltransferase RsmA [Tepidisphaeraceae bacterium]